MAWHCSGTTNQEMVSKLKEAKIVQNDRVEAAMLAVDRAKYCHEPDPYEDRPRRIGYNVNISAPHMHAYALSFLTDRLTSNAKALDVGSGSGYLTACMAHMVGPGGLVVGVEHIPELARQSMKNIQEGNPDFLREGRIKIIEGDGRLGVADHGPYDAIHVGAAAESLPQELIDQLAQGGRLICPVVAIERLYQNLLQVDKNYDGTIKEKKIMTVKYVPLTDVNTQLNN
ncbi:hypothetical protein QAD02_012507 [Eretmocerus hayati]|uniref:Uncharacterized protein n=1 Tax=Eretmocerus hayati TaxID=131215 RepID=A0ACC2NZL9_9HYME|nr:hypothetical protein QAD02_012507 [Eretmocerus hayati]